MYSYERTVNKSADEIFGELHKILKEKEWLIVSYIDLNELFKKLNKPFEPYYILDVCYPPAAVDLIKDNMDIGSFIPCKLVLIQNKDKTKIIMPRPSVESKDYLGSTGEVARKYEDMLTAIIDTL